MDCLEIGNLTGSLYNGRRRWQIDRLPPQHNVRRWCHFLVQCSHVLSLPQLPTWNNLCPKKLSYYPINVNTVLFLIILMISWRSYTFKYFCGWISWEAPVVILDLVVLSCKEPNLVLNHTIVITTGQFLPWSRFPFYGLVGSIQSNSEWWETRAARPMMVQHFCEFSKIQ